MPSKCFAGATPPAAGFFYCAEQGRVSLLAALHTSQIRRAQRHPYKLAVRGAEAASCRRAGAAGRTAPCGILLRTGQVSRSKRQRHFDHQYALSDTAAARRGVDEQGLVHQASYLSVATSVSLGTLRACRASRNAVGCSFQRQLAFTCLPAWQASMTGFHVTPLPLCMHAWVLHDGGPCKT